MNESIDAAGTDFLGRIVDKALGRDGGLRPRVPSLFEPVFHTGIGMAENPQAMEATGEAAGDTLPSLREYDGVHTQRAVRVTDAQPEKVPIRSRPQQSAPFAARTTEAVPVAPIPVAGMSIQPAAALLPISGDRDTPAPPRPAALRVPSAGADDTLESAGVRTPVAATADEAESGRLSPQHGALTPLFDRNAHAISAEPLDMHHRSASQQSRPENSAVGMKPVVNVTIDRVEVRATVQPSPAPRRIEARAPRPMSLDDYLKRRGSGR